MSGAAALARLRRRRRADRAAGWLVRAGGAAIVLSIFGILGFIVAQVLPLFRPARVERVESIGTAVGEPRGLLSDPWAAHVVEVDGDGRLSVVRVDDGALVAEASPLGAGVRPTAVALARARDEVALGTAEGGVAIAVVAWDAHFEAGVRRVQPRIEVLETVAALPGVSIGAVALQSLASGRLLAVASPAGEVALLRLVREENAFTGEVTSRIERQNLAATGEVVRLELDDAGRRLYGVRHDQALVWWELDAPDAAPAHVVEAGGRGAVTALAMLVGGRSLLVGRASGAVEVWFEATRAGQPQLVRTRVFDLFAAPVAAFAPSRRHKAAVAASVDGDLALFHSTSERTLWRGHAALRGAPVLVMAPRGDTFFVASSAEVDVFSVDAPHPELSLGALFGRVWYEGYPAPAFVWQSSSGTDDFEPKLSLVPLMLGTIKGTLYSLLIAVPLAVLSAMYVAQFMAPEIRRLVKPLIEIMAAMPSVVLGFLAGLWLAPRVATILPAFVLGVVLVPLGSLAAGAGWEALPARWRRHLPRGTEVIFFVIGVLAAARLAFDLGPWLETTAFGGDLAGWLAGTLGLPYDQRNAVVVGVAMGFAVIPIIFAIAEDAFENVPANLVSASLALGANRWQTVTRVVFPTASPGIFSAVMVGFGRAVGETMIVLMATGNTPILEWNPFNGFRTLSANIAVEIPEAPQGGTLYRVLFLAALALFLLTFTVNTAAELIRGRLRRRYASL